VQQKETVKDRNRTKNIACLRSMRKRRKAMISKKHRHHPLLHPVLLSGERNRYRIVYTMFPSSLISHPQRKTTIFKPKKIIIIRIIGTLQIPTFASPLRKSQSPSIYSQDREYSPRTPTITSLYNHHRQVQQ
jgi:hypothetical protein